MDAEGVLAVTFTARAAGELRGRLRALGVGGVQARTFHAAALRQLTYFWPQVVGGEPPRLVESKLRLVAEAATRSLRVSLPTAELRDVTSEIEWAKSSLVTADDLRGRRGQGAPPAAPSARDGRRDLRGLRGGQDALRAARLRGPAAADRRHDRGAPRGRRADPRRSTATSSSTSTRTSTRCSSSCSTPGSGRATTCAWSATPTRRSTRSPAPRRTTSSTSPAAGPTPTVVRLTRDYRSTPQVVALANGVLAKATGDSSALRLALVAQRPSGPEPSLPRVRRRAGRGRRVLPSGWSS